VLTRADFDRRKLLKIAGGCAIIYQLDGAPLRSPREMPKASSGGSATDPLGHASPHAAAAPQPRPDTRAHCDVAAWHAGRSIGGFRFVIVAAADHQTVADTLGGRWIEKSTHWSREKMLCEHRQTIRVVASFMPARPG
jgi:hypothetical protein